MKYLILLLFLSSCYTQNQAIKKFCNTDTAQIILTVHDTFIVDSIHVDTLFKDKIDSVFFVKNKIQIKYIRLNGNISLESKYLGDTFYKIVIVKVDKKCITPKLSWIDKIAIESLWWLVGIIVLLMILVVYRK